MEHLHIRRVQELLAIHMHIDFYERDGLGKDEEEFFAVMDEDGWVQGRCLTLYAELCERQVTFSLVSSCCSCSRRTPATQ